MGGNGTSTSAICNKFHALVATVWTGGVNLGTDQLYIMFTNTAPDPAADVYYSDIEANELYYGYLSTEFRRNGYPAGGFPLVTSNTLQINGGTMAPSTFILKGNVLTFTPPFAYPVGPFRYVVLYDYTAPGQPLLGWWDLQTSISLWESPNTNGYSAFVLQTDAINGILQQS
jgi:hypothetical protein